MPFARMRRQLTVRWAESYVCKRVSLPLPLSNLAQTGTLTEDAQLRLPPGTLVRFATYDATNDVIIAVVHSTIGNCHVLLLDRALSTPPLMDAVVLEVMSFGARLRTSL